MIRQCPTGHLSLNAANWECPWCEVERLRQIVKGVHGALTDAGSVVVPGSLDADLYAPVMQLVKERDEAKANIALLDQAATDYRKSRDKVTRERDDAVEMHKTCHKERDEARAEAKKYHDALVARHGGEPVALLEELDASKAKVERLEGLILDCADDAPGSAGKLQRESRRIRAQRGRGPFAPNVMFQTYKRLLGLEERTRREEGK